MGQLETTQYLAKLRQAIIEGFNKSEIESLCFDLGIRYDSLSGETLDDKVRELIFFFIRRDNLNVLVEICYKERPNFPWPEVPQELSQPEKTRVWVEENLESLSQFDAPKFADNVIRPQLITRLRELAGSKPIVAVEGLSGCGKSYLVSSWLEDSATLSTIKSVLWYDPQVNDSLGYLLNETN